MPRKSTVLQLALLGGVLLVPASLAQETTAPAPAPAPAPPSVTPAHTEAGPDTTDAEREEGVGINYDPQGRRDPFRPLTGEAADTELRKKYEHTLKGRLLSEVRLTSILKHPDGNIATFEGGPKKQGYFAKVGDELWDGTVIDINADTLTVVVRQRLEDPNQIKQWRDIPIPLYTEPVEGADSGGDGGSAPSGGGGPGSR
jgi:hypothetical protein